MEFYAVSLCNLSWDTTSQLYMECLTDLIFFARSSRVNIKESAFCITITFLSAVSRVGLSCFVIPTAMLETKSLNTLLLEVIIPSKMDVSLFVIWATLLCKSSSMLCGLQWMQPPNVLLLRITLDMCLHGNFICTVELRRLAALKWYVLCVIKFFAIHQHMGPAQWGKTCWQKLTSQS